jgi:anaerobic C4-dicarboxylate transporter
MIGSTPGTPIPVTPALARFSAGKTVLSSTAMIVEVAEEAGIRPDVDIDIAVVGRETGWGWW